MFFYDRTIPDIGDIVACKIKEITQSGIFVSLLEYDDLAAYVPLKEISTHRYRSLSGLVKENDIEFIQVTTVDSEKQYIDLTRKYIDEDEKVKALNKYTLLKRIYTILKYSKMDNDIIQDYTQKIQQISKNDITTTTLENLEFTPEIVLKVFPEEKSQIFKHKLNITSFIQNFIHIRSVKLFITTIEDLFDVRLQVCDIKKGEVLIITKNKMKQAEFETLKKNILIKLNTLTKEEKVGEDEMITLHEKVGTQPKINIGIIGNVSSGKTTLIEALSGIDTRKYKKEIESNRTLKLGYINILVIKCACKGNINYVIKRSDDCPCEERIFSIIDVPGHNVLLSTMLSGASIMDTTMLIIAANEPCPQKQTKEHLVAMEIINDDFQHFDNIIVQNKIDVVSREKAMVSFDEITSFIKGTSIENSQIFPISAKKKINTQSILKHIFDLDLNKTNRDTDNLQAIIVRNFDINKPGSSEIKGLVLGCSILSGKIKIGDYIFIVPHRLKIRVTNIKTAEDNLNEAVSGGLIALETDASSFLINKDLIGAMIISCSDYQPSNFYRKASDIMIKCYPVENKQKFKVDDNITLNLLSRDIPGCIIKQVYKTSKHKYKITLSKDIYVPNDNSLKISILVNNRLYGYGKLCDIIFTDKPKQESITTFKTKQEQQEMYKLLLDSCYKNLEETKVKLRLPQIVVEYKHTFTQIFNFDVMSNFINTPSYDLGLYIKNELGMRNFTIKPNVLSLKGRTNENNIQKTIIKYLKENKLCPCCGSINTEKVKRMNVKKIHCLDC